MLKEKLKKIMGLSNVMYLRSFFPTKQEQKNRKIRKRFYSKLVTKDMLCFDAGANFGNRIQPMLASGARVVA
ncbi:MAG TPA: hypothetical protein DEF88_13630, partial [Porphyromonadaceae bacterium]|nr:hypothetical protein [Porphyromonadaceae bacterium]